MQYNKRTRAENSSAPNRLRAVERLYTLNLTHIKELIHADPHITADAGNQIAASIVQYLPAYGGPLTDKPFQQWLTDILVPVVGFHAIRRVCEPFVRKAIWRGLGHAEEPSKFDDYPETVRELEQDVWAWTFFNLEKLQKPGTASITTRLFERAKVMTRDWMKRQRTRRAAVIRRVYNLPSKAKTKAAERLAAELDRSQRQAEQERIEREEIQCEMKKLALMD